MTVSAEPAAFVAPRCPPAFRRWCRNARSRRAAFAPCAVCPPRRSAGESRSMTTDYRATVFLPKTSFPMRASLPTREPELLERWQRLDLYGRLRDRGRRAREVHPARWPAVRERPSAHGHRAQQDPQGRGQPQPADAGQGRGLRPGLGLPRPADRMADRAALPPGGQGQGCGADRRVPARVPRVRRALDRRPAQRVQAPRRGRRLGPSLHHHGAPGRGGDLSRARQVPAVRPAVPRQEVGDVVGRGEDRARRGRGRVPRPHLDHDRGPLPGGRAGASRARRRLGR